MALDPSLAPKGKGKKVEDPLFVPKINSYSLKLAAKKEHKEKKQLAELIQNNKINANNNTNNTDNNNVLGLNSLNNLSNVLADCMDASSVVFDENSVIDATFDAQFSHGGMKSPHGVVNSHAAAVAGAW